MAKDKNEKKPGKTEDDLKEKEVKAEEEAGENKEAKKPEKEKKEDKKDDKIKELEKELAAQKEAHIRTLAEYDNYRKRTQKEKEAIFSDSKVKIIGEFLPLADNFERAIKAESTDLESLKKGVEMTYNDLMNAFAKLSVETYGEPGDKFDPNIHHAVLHVDDDSLEENVITDVFSKGYKTGDKIIRAAIVKVAN